MGKPPRMFISYSWTSADYERRVIKLAEDLVGSGIDVVLDKWDLKTGHDANAFMEGMVSDPSVTKVAILADERYVSKANDRKGGVGAETQIISAELYGAVKQDKFAVVVMERDSEGNPYIPIYYRGKIYIDLSDISNFAVEFDRLLRWAHDRPLYEKPALGRIPDYLAADSARIHLSTSAAYQRALDGLRNDRVWATAAVGEFFDKVRSEMPKFAMTVSGEGVFDERLVANIEQFLPFRDEIVSIVIAAAQYMNEEEAEKAVHRLLESMIPLLSFQGDSGTYNESDYDNFRFLVHELFLYFMAIFIKYERFVAASSLMGEYYVPAQSRYRSSSIVDFTTFRQHVRGLVARNNRLKLNRHSVAADMLDSRAKAGPISFYDLMQADFVIFLRASLEDKSWWPETLVFHSFRDRGGPMELFARARSKKYFDRMKVLFGIQSKSDLDRVLEEFRDGTKRVPSWQGDSFNPASIVGIEAIASRP
ncbi:MAG: TIR domain-containing protein [Bauldia sp.]|nr:TIR domain-containing protein [Bauldia sp.]